MVKEFQFQYVSPMYLISAKAYAKQCALICVDEIDNAIDFDWMEIQNLDSQHRYWQKVREEIETYGGNK